MQSKHGIPQIIFSSPYLILEDEIMGTKQTSSKFTLNKDKI